MRGGFQHPRWPRGASQIPYPSAQIVGQAAHTTDPHLEQVWSEMVSTHSSEEERLRAGTLVKTGAKKRRIGRPTYRFSRRGR